MKHPLRLGGHIGQTGSRKLLITLKKQREEKWAAPSLVKPLNKSLNFLGTFKKGGLLARAPLENIPHPHRHKVDGRSGEFAVHIVVGDSAGFFAALQVGRPGA